MMNEIEIGTLIHRYACPKVGCCLILPIKIGAQHNGNVRSEKFILVKNIALTFAETCVC